MKKIISKILILITTVALSISIAFAEECPFTEGDLYDSDYSLNLDCILKTSNQDQSYLLTTEDTAPVENLLIRVIDYMLAIVGSISLLMIIIAGFMIITSPGNENQRTKANDMIASSLIGLVFAFTSYILVNFVQGFFY